MEENKKEEEIEIDFTKIKSFFINLKNKLSKQSSSDDKSGSEDDLNLDFSKIINFVKTHSTLCVLLLLLFLQFIPNYGFLPWGGIWMRMQDDNLPLLENLVTNNVYAGIKAEIQNNVDKKYPFLPDDKKQAKIDEELNNELTKNNEQITQYIKNAAEQAKEFYRYDVNGAKYSYMPDIDPYYYLRYARNYLDHGYMGDIKINGEEYDNHVLAPVGWAVDTNILHPYVLAYIHKFLSIFNKNIPLMRSAAYFPVILLFLSIFPIFFIVKRFTNVVGGCFAASLLLFHSTSFTRTMFGYADTDAYNIFFPLMISWIFIESFENKDLKKKLMLSLLAGFFTGVYAVCWSGWWYVFDFILFSILAYLAYFVFVNRSNLKGLVNVAEFKNKIYILLVLFFSSGLFVTLFAHFKDFMNAFLSPLGFRVIKEAVRANLWPNVYVTVAELNPISISDTIKNEIGSIYFFIALIGIFAFIYKKDKFGSRSVAYIVFFIVWFISTVYAATKGIRFTLLIVPSLSIAFGTGVGLIYEESSLYLNKYFNYKIIVNLILIILLALLLIPQVQESYKTTMVLPLIDDAWWGVLSNINNSSSKDAIITSWWDFGHHFKYVADRSVTFDGGSQDTPIAYWVGKLLLSDDENVSLGILRMLDCGSNSAFNVLNKEVNDSIKSVKILNDIIVLNKTEAISFLVDSDIKNVDAVINYTHCDPPEAFIVTSGDMISKAPVWGHFGSWDFEKADLWYNKNNSKQEMVDYMMNKYNYSNATAEDYYDQISNLKGNGDENFWISPWPRYLSNVGSCIANNSLIECDQMLMVNDGMMPSRLILNYSNKNVILATPNGNILLKSLIYFDNSSFNTLMSNDNGVSSVMVVNKGENYYSIIGDELVLKSIFTRLYFLGGYGLKNFVLFDSKNNIDGNKVVAWKINWTSFST